MTMMRMIEQGVMPWVVKYIKTDLHREMRVLIMILLFPATLEASMTLMENKSTII